jgi:hypothetical protein
VGGLRADVTTIALVQQVVDAVSSPLVVDPLRDPSRDLLCDHMLSDNAMAWNVIEPGRVGEVARATEATGRLAPALSVRTPLTRPGRNVVAKARQALL